MTSLVILSSLLSLAVITNLLFLVFGRKGINETVESYYREFHPNSSDQPKTEVESPAERKD